MQGGTNIEEKLFNQILVGDNIDRNDKGEATFTNITLSVCAMQAVTYNDNTSIPVEFDTNNIPSDFVSDYDFAE